MNSDIQKANREKNLGNECFSAKNYHEAAKHFTNAIDLNPDDHVFYSNRSACYANLEEYDKALVDAQICVDIKPDWTKGYLRRGLAEFHLQKYEQALTLIHWLQRSHRISFALQKLDDILTTPTQLSAENKEQSGESDNMLNSIRFHQNLLTYLQLNHERDALFLSLSYLESSGESGKKAIANFPQYLIDDLDIKDSQFVTKAVLTHQITSLATAISKLLSETEGSTKELCLLQSKFNKVCHYLLETFTQILSNELRFGLEKHSNRLKDLSFVMKTRLLELDSTVYPCNNDGLSDN